MAIIKPTSDCRGQTTDQTIFSLCPVNLLHLHPDCQTASATQSVPIHIFRFTDRSQSILSNQSIVQPQPRTNQQPQKPLSLSPTDIDICSPTPIRISLFQTLIRRSEPLELCIRIPPPSNQAFH
ncbi:hypothetical protein PPACK8108_LOCUS25022 [Phakopsora pachyrhizi]|uniref:Uncharacterized protein n=1 Tax=Phakopsora pachyrhizi TaxID=170000 RepID=A0AAV0BUC8_PHAPC|nr:hypothetical protein PPACK8108_LOCUS25022 [Phakopsora pachyrhizi]